MRRDILQKAVQTKPFKPFRLFTTDGGSYVIRHPELCVIGLQEVFVALNKTGETDSDWNTFALIDLSHVAKMRVVEEWTGQQATG